MRDPDAPAYASKKKLENSEAGQPLWHVDEDCSTLQTHADEVEELTVAEAREECARQAQCCSSIDALEDLD
jgi:hypothetical protein